MFVQRAALATLIALAVAPCANAQKLFFSPGEGGMPIITAMNDLVPLIKRADVQRGIEANPKGTAMTELLTRKQELMRRLAASG